MTPAARYAAAMDVLDAWADGFALEQALTRWARGARYAGSGDRAAVRDHVYDVLRSKGRCAVLGGGETGRALILGLLRLQEVPEADVFTGEGHAPAPLSTAEMQRPDTMPDTALDVADWMRALLSERTGADLPALLHAFGERAPVYLRVNRRKADVDRAIAALEADDVDAKALPGTEGALEVVTNPRRLRQTAAYRDGWVEVQDLSAQRAVAAVPWPETGRILDYCAGGGGKTLAIADRTEATLFAHDAKPERMADLTPRAARAGITVTQLEPGAVPGHGPFDAVLCDVPCSGSGTWRRDPEAKWRLTRARLEALVETQMAILAEAAPHVAPGGLLIYMTCSLFRAENEVQAAAFEARHPHWQRIIQKIDTPLTASDGFFTTAWRVPAAV